ncbi:MAG: RNA 2',3'-cyclic phosphodiesterase [Anaerolineales bacterium]|nr:RNA 2',3'-cyclic phosphodiesterase [Anaerolineales bacterium]
MSVIRAFIAIELTAEIQKRLDEISAAFKQQLNGVPVRWVAAGNIHLTLKFLGDVSVANLKLLTDILKTEIGTHRPFDVSVGGAGAFPNNRRPRVIWVGVEAPSDLAAIQSGVEAAMARLGYPREDRPFSPHLTIGRVSRNATSDDTRSITKALETSRVGFLGAACVQEICLFRSDLQPSGAVYTRIFTAPLGQPV